MAKVYTNNQLLLKECISQEFKETGLFSDESSYFEYFACSQVLKNYDLSDDELSDGILGGGNDGGCDGIYLFLNNYLVTPDQIPTLSAPKGSTLNLVIVQAKNTTGFGEDAIMKWKTVTENLMKISCDVSSFAGRYNDDVLDHFTMFRDSITRLIRSQIKIKIDFYYVTLATEKHINVNRQADELCEKIHSMYPTAAVSVTFVGADELMSLYYTDTETSINLEFADQPIALGRNVDYVALVNLATYFKFITDKDGKLKSSFFEANVRDYQGNNSVNGCIATSLNSNSSEDFWWLNNGVTILSEKITPVTNRELLIINPEIVNGLQTSTEIYNYFSSNPDKLDSEKRNVLVRIIVPADEASRDNIIFATNNQTNIPKSSLRVTDTIHLQIEMYFKSRGLYYDRRKNYYKNQKKKATDIVGVSFLAQCLITIFLRKPDFARARPSTLLTDDTTYNFLYAENTDLDVYYKTARLGKRIQQNLAKCADYTPAERSDILYYLLYGVVAQNIGKKDISFSDFKSFDSSAISDESIITTRDAIYKRYKELGGNGRVAKSAQFVDEIDTLLNIPEV